MDLSKLSDDDLQALKAGDLSKVSTEGLHALRGTPAEPATPLSRTEKVTQGMVDPINGGAQLLTHVLPGSVVNAGNRFNNWLADKTGLVGRLPDGGVDRQVREGEAKYEARRAAGGESGFDGYRMTGNVLSPANWATGAGAMVPRAANLLTRAGAGAMGGGLSALLNPVTQGDSSDYWTEKGKQVGAGVVGGGLAAPVVGAVGRLVSPNASRNPNVNLLKAEGVEPTLGQTLGGWANRLEEKAQSMPLMGDMINAARGRSREQFNVAAINRAVEPIGAKVTDAGQSGVVQAGNALSKAYDDAINQVKFFKLDPKYTADRAQLDQMAQGLVPTMRNVYRQTVKTLIDDRISPTGAILGKTFKDIDSELGKDARDYLSSSVASERKLGEALQQAQSLLREQLGRSNPQASAQLKAADEGWANLVRVEGASKLAKNSEGVFTPGMLNSSIQTADKSVRKRAVARGEALMQDLGNAGQQVLGNKVPNSGTAERTMIGLGGLGLGVLSPMIPAGLAAGGLLYTRPVQNLLSGAITTRHQSAQAVAEALRRASPALSPAAAQIALERLNH
jgi:hypothetical protein